MRVGPTGVLLPTNAQVIEKDGKAEGAVTPQGAERELAEDAEILRGIRDYDRVKKPIEAGEELFPSEAVYATLAAKSLIRVRG